MGQLARGLVRTCRLCETGEAGWTLQIVPLMLIPPSESTDSLKKEQLLLSANLRRRHAVPRGGGNGRRFQLLPLHHGHRLRGNTVVGSGTGSWGHHRRAQCDSPIARLDRSTAGGGRSCEAPATTVAAPATKTFGAPPATMRMAIAPACSVVTIPIPSGFEPTTCRGGPPGHGTAPGYEPARRAPLGGRGRAGPCQATTVLFRRPGRHGDARSGFRTTVGVWLDNWQRWDL